METNKIYQGDALEVLKTFPDESINCIMTSPPYFNQRDYGVEGQLGLEISPEDEIVKIEVMELREDLTEEQKLFLIQELKKRKCI